MSKFSSLLRLLVVGTLISFPFHLDAQGVVLKSKSGNVEIDGNLVEFDGEFYKIETDLGVLTVDGSSVICTGTGCPPIGEFVSRFSVVGSDALGRILLPALIEAFGVSVNGEVEVRQQSQSAQSLRVFDSAGVETAAIDVSIQSESLAFEQLSNREADIVAASRLPTAAEVRRIKSAGLGNLIGSAQQQILAIDAIVVVVSRVNPIETISLDDLRKVLGGKIRNWKDLGGPDAEIVLYSTAGNEAYTTELSARGLNLTVPEGTENASQRVHLSDVSDAVASDPFGIGLTSFSNLRNAKTLGLRGDCGVYSSPNNFSLKSGEYPLVYTHSLYQPKVRLPLFAREFLDFVTTQQARNIVSGLGFADAGISEMSIDQQGNRLAISFAQAGNNAPLNDVRNLMLLLNGAKRLSTTFRFEPGSKSLDARSQDNAEQLALGLILGNYSDKVVQLIGFSDSAGSSEQNNVLSKKRAETVRGAIVAASPDGSLDDVMFEVSGFGEASPLACEDSESGKQTNRRVEVWVKDRN